MRISLAAIGLMVAFGIIALINSQSSQPARAVERAIPATPPQKPTHPLANVEDVRRAVEPILPVSSWGETPGVPGFYGYSEFVYPDFAIQSNLEYHLMGPSRSEVREIIFAGFVASPERLKPVKTIMESAVEQWRKSLGIALPAGLVEAIRGGRNLEAASEKLKFSYTVERGSEIRQMTGGSYRCTLMNLRVAII